MTLKWKEILKQVAQGKLILGEILITIYGIAHDTLLLASDCIKYLFLLPSIYIS
jgi:hypothetical protein